MGRKFGREMCGVLPFRSDKTDTLYPTMSAVPNLVGARGLLATSWLALRAVAGATFSRFARAEPPRPPEVLILMSYKCKKACSLSRHFEFGR